MANVFLIGGGGDAAAARANYSIFIDACHTSSPRIGCVVVDEGEGLPRVERVVAAMREAGDCQPEPIVLPVGGHFDPTVLDSLDALFVCGGSTPAYADAIVPAAAPIRQWLDNGPRPYGGFSAGAEIASTRAIVGGWQLDGVTLCHEDCSEDLDELAVVDGLGLVPFAVEVHCAQWGTLSRVVAAVESGAVRHAIALDEDTMLCIDRDSATVAGLGRGWVVTPTTEGVNVTSHRAGGAIVLPLGR